MCLEGEINEQGVCMKKSVLEGLDLVKFGV